MHYFFTVTSANVGSQLWVCFSVIIHQPDNKISHRLTSNLQIMYVKRLECWRAKNRQFTGEICEICFLTLDIQILAQIQCNPEPLWHLDVVNFCAPCNS